MPLGDHCVCFLCFGALFWHILFIIFYIYIFLNFPCFTYQKRYIYTLTTINNNNKNSSNGGGGNDSSGGGGGGGSSSNKNSNGVLLVIV